MYVSVEVGKEDDLASVGSTKSSRPCYRLVRPTGVDRSKSVIRIVNGQISKLVIGHLSVEGSMLAY